MTNKTQDDKPFADTHPKDSAHESFRREFERKAAADKPETGEIEAPPKGKETVPPTPDEINSRDEAKAGEYHAPDNATKEANFTNLFTEDHDDHYRVIMDIGRNIRFTLLEMPKNVDVNVPLFKLDGKDKTVKVG